MTVLFRSFVVWLLLLALPYQGYASAQMVLCAEPAPAAAHIATAMPAGPHDHAAMLAAQAKSSHDAHGSVKCNGSACCSAAAPLLILAFAAPTAPLVARVAPVYSDFLPAVDLAHPERPPQGLYA